MKYNIFCVHVMWALWFYTSTLEKVLNVCMLCFIVVEKKEGKTTVVSSIILFLFVPLINID